MLRQELKTDLQVLRQDNVLIRKEMELLSSRLVVQPSSMLVIGFELTIAALKYFLN